MKIFAETRLPDTDVFGTDLETATQKVLCEALARELFKSGLVTYVRNTDRFSGDEILQASVEVN